MKVIADSMAKRLGIGRGITDAFVFAAQLFPLPRESLRGGGEETAGSYFPPDAKLAKSGSERL